MPPESRGTVPRSVSRGLSQGLHGLRSAKVATKSRKGWSRLRGGRYSWGSYRPICLAGRRTARGQWLPVPLQLRNWCETVTLRVSGGGRGGGGRREGSPQQAGLLESGAGWRFLWFLRLQLLSVKSSSAHLPGCGLLQSPSPEALSSSRPGAVATGTTPQRPSTKALSRLSCQTEEVEMGTQPQDATLQSLWTWCAVLSFLQVLNL